MGTPLPEWAPPPQPVPPPAVEWDDRLRAELEEALQDPTQGILECWDTALQRSQCRPSARAVALAAPYFLRAHPTLPYGVGWWRRMLRNRGATSV